MRSDRAPRFSGTGTWPLCNPGFTGSASRPPDSFRHKAIAVLRLLSTNQEFRLVRPGVALTDVNASVEGGLGGIDPSETSAELDRCLVANLRQASPSNVSPGGVCTL
jgi:hypothetical protein